MREPKQDPAYDAQIAAAKEAVKEALKAEESARQATRAAKEAMERICSRAWGVEPGVRVINRRGQEFSISRASFSYGEPWLYGHKIKKNGEPGAREQHIGGNWKFAE